MNGLASLWTNELQHDKFASHGAGGPLLNVPRVLPVARAHTHTRGVVVFQGGPIDLFNGSVYFSFSRPCSFPYRRPVARHASFL